MKTRLGKLAKADYVRRDPEGRLTAIFCKSCGARVASRGRRGQLVYGPEYTEVKIQFDDRSHHVTNGCKDCLSMETDPDLLQLLYEADCMDDPGCYLKDRKAVKVVSLAHGTQGIA